MTLLFEQRNSYGKARFYPANKAAAAVVRLTGRVCLKADELEMLRDAGGFKVVAKGAGE